MKYNITKNLGLVLVLISLTVFRLTLATKGHFHLQDELRYRYSFAFIREVVTLHPVEAMRQMFAFPLFARPLLVLFNLPTASLQVLLLLITGIKTETPVSLSFVSAVQAIATTGVSWVMYLLARRYLKSRLLSLAATIIFSLLINTNLYIRHIMPYDTALLVYLVWLHFMLTRSNQWNSIKITIGSAVVAGIMHLVYPAYYLFGLILGWLAMFIGLRKEWLLRAIIFTMIVTAVMVLTDLTSRFFGGAYFSEAKFVTSRVVVGSPQETPYFLFNYLWQVEGTIGKLLTAGLILFLGHVIIFHKNYGKEFKLLTAGVVISYLVHGLSGPLAGKVFYGRSVHMFFWFVVLANMVIIDNIFRKVVWKQVSVLGLTLVALISFIGWYPTFLKLEYPNDVLYRICKQTCKNIVSVYSENFPQGSRENYPVQHPEYVGVNFTREFYPVNAPTYDYTPKQGELIFKTSHPINFIGYQYEGYTLEERKLVRQKNYQMKLYKLQ